MSTTLESANPRLRKYLQRGVVILAALVAALFFAITFFGAIYQPDVAIPSHRKGTHVAVAGNQIRYHQQGTGPDILLIHGSPGSLEDWESIIDSLATDYRVTAYDRPGHGYSESRDNLHTYDYHASVAIELIEALDLRDVTVVGHSYGGTTALALALRKPPQVKNIVVLDSAAYEPKEPPSGLYRLLAMRGFGTGVARLIGPTIAPRKIREGLVAQFRGDPPPGFLETRSEIWNQPKVTTSVARESLQASAHMAAMSGRYREIAYPTFIAAQAGDPFRRQTAERLQREIPASKLLLLDDTGHYVHVEKAEDVIGLIRKAADERRPEVSE